jgi:hypothetical protein
MELFVDCRDYGVQFVGLFIEFLGKGVNSERLTIMEFPPRLPPLEIAAGFRRLLIPSRINHMTARPEYLQQCIHAESTGADASCS